MSKQSRVIVTFTIGLSFVGHFIINNAIVGVDCRRIYDDERTDLQTAYDEMKVIRKIADEDLPRRAIVEALQKGHFFQDIFSEHLEPLKIQFGHVCENPNEWEQRFERKDLKNNKHQGKVLWGNKNGEYSEHYWDLNHR